MGIAVNYLYFLHFLDENFSKDKCLSLDYGCGKGDFISYANKNGYRFRGIDNYYDSINFTAFQNSTVKDYIDIIDNTGVLPFSGKTFDFITSIQVFEHVENIEVVLNEINRVLKDDGKLLCSFPFKFSYKEGHYGIPFSHWFKPSSKIRKLWVLIFYKFGFGVGRNANFSYDEWYRMAFNFIDEFCYYRTKREFLACCNRAYFTVHSKGKEKILYHLRQRKGLFSKILILILKVLPSCFISFLVQIRGSVCLELIKTTHNKV